MKNIYLIIISIAILAVIAGYGGFWFYKTNVYPPVGNTCFELLTGALEVARSNQRLSVPAFADRDVERVHCVAAPGFVAFELAGKDAAGQDFRLVEVSGGRAASGADMIFDYCYMQGDTILSQTRVRGREGTVSTSTCTYDPDAVVEPVVRYDFSR